MKKWIELDGFDCLNCGSGLEVNTDAKQVDNDQGTYIHDSDDVRCTDCCFISSMNVDGDEDETEVYISEGNLDELESK